MPSIRFPHHFGHTFSAQAETRDCDTTGRSGFKLQFMRSHPTPDGRVDAARRAWLQRRCTRFQTIRHNIAQLDCPVLISHAEIFLTAHPYNKLFQLGTLVIQPWRRCRHIFIFDLSLANINIWLVARYGIILREHFTDR